MEKRSIECLEVPEAIGPYLQAIKVDDVVYVSGQLPINRQTGLFSGEDIESQTRQSLENVKAILSETGYGMDRIVKTSVLMKDLDDFAKMNNVYMQYFKEPFPARTTFQVAKLPKGAKIEVEVIAR